LLRRKISRKASEWDSARLSMVHLLKMIAQETRENTSRMRSTPSPTGPESRTI